MATALYSFKLDTDGKIRVAHVFFGDTEAEAEANLKAHAGICPKYGPAYRNKETVEVAVDCEALPESDDPEAWLDAFLDLDGDDDDDDDPEDEEDEDEETDDEG